MTAYILMKFFRLSPSNPYHDIKVKSALMIKPSEPFYYPLSDTICCRRIITMQLSSTQALSVHIRHSILHLILPGDNTIVGHEKIWLQKVIT